MNVTTIVTQLTLIATGSSMMASSIAQRALQVTRQYEAGELSLSEYQELIGDIQTEQLIFIEAAAITLKQQLAALFSTITSAAQIVTA